MKIRKILLYLCFLCSLFLVVFSAHADTGVQVIETAGEAVLGDEMTPSQAKALALNNARRVAIEQAAGVEIRGTSFVYNFQLVSDLISSATRGLIVKEEILSEDIRKDGKQIIYLAKIRAEVKTLVGREKGNLKIIKADVHRYGSAPSTSIPVFQDNDEIQVAAKLNGDAYISIFSISQDGLVSRLYPNEYFKAEKSPNGKAFSFPNEQMRSLGLKIRVRTPKKQHKVVETIMIVATNNNENFLADKNSTVTTVTDLMKELAELDAALWIETTMGYEIRK